MQAEIHENHRWLAQLVGEWEFEGESDMGPDKPPMRSKGRETVRMLGELWMIAEGEGEFPGTDAACMRMTIGYDPALGRFVGSWVGSMMTHLWVYEGELDEERKILTMNTTGPDFESPGKTRQYRDIFEIVSDDERLMRSEMLTDNGWAQIMQAHYKRVAG